MTSTDLYSDSFTIPEQLHVAKISFDGDLVTIYATTANYAAKCPLCEQLSRRVHGRYSRTLADLLWSGTPVRLRIQVRKFFSRGRGRLP